MKKYIYLQRSKIPHFGLDQMKTKREPLREAWDPNVDLIKLGARNFHDNA